MNSESPNKLNAQIYDEASQWFVEFRTGDVKVSDRRKFSAWLRRSPEHMRAYLELAAIWNEGVHLDPNHRFDSDEIGALDYGETKVIPLSVSRVPVPPCTVAGAGSGAQESDKTSPRVEVTTWNGRFTPFRVPLAAVAASLFVIAGIWGYIERNTYSTAVGEQRSLALGDGSTINLNAHSKVRIQFTADRRSVELLQGQALFQVAKDKTRPFIVRSGGATVRAVGTEFDVNRRMSGTTVTVLEGRVAVLPQGAAEIAATTRRQASSVERKTASDVSNNPRLIDGRNADRLDTTHLVIGLPAPSPLRETISGEEQNSGALNPKSGRDGRAEPSLGGSQVTNTREFILAAGEQAILTAQTTVKPSQPNIAAATAWRQRRLVFESATLAEVAEEFNRYNERRLVIQSPDRDTLHITGVFASTDPESLIRFLQTRPGIVVTETAREIVITRKSP